LGIGDWGPIPNPQSPIPNPQSPIPIVSISKKLCSLNIIKRNNLLKKYNFILNNLENE